MDAGFRWLVLPLVFLLFSPIPSVFTGIHTAQAQQRVLNVAPPNGATNVSVTTDVVVWFYSTATAVSSNTFRVSAGGFNILDAIGGSGTTWRFTPLSNLALNTVHTVTVEGVRDEAGIPMASAFTSTFTTAAAPQPVEAWLVTGNASTNPNTNFVGTTDQAGFAVRVGGTEALRWEYSTSPAFSADRFTASRLARASHPGTFVWADDTGTQFSSTADNQFLIRASGGVGIGTVRPSGQLEISGSAEQAGTLHLRPHANKGPNSSHVHWDATGDWYIRSAASSGKVIIQDSGGNVGIGTTSPGAKLDVIGEGRFGNGSDFISLSFDSVNSRLSAVGTGDLAINWDNGKHTSVGLGVARTGNLLVGGNVGIGTSAPTERLQVEGNVRATGNVHIRGVGTIDGDLLVRRLASFDAGISTGGNITYFGKLGKLDVDENFAATVRAADFRLGWRYRHPGLPPDWTGRALVDNGDTLVVNFGPDWPKVSIDGNVDVGGNLHVHGRITQASSREFKENMSAFSGSKAQGLLNSLAPVEFNYRGDNEKTLHVGFVAEQVPAMLASQDGKGISLVDIIAVLTKVVQEQQKAISALEEKVRALTDEGRR